jgi:phenylacetic acid degradation protein
MIAWKTEGTHLYQRLPAQLHRSLRECEPLRELPANRTVQPAVLKTWHETRKK